MSKTLGRLLIACVFTLLGIFLAPARAGWQPYNWLITVETKLIPGELVYSGSTLYPVVESRIKYASADGKTEDTKYETIWFCQGKAYGLERDGPLNTGLGQSVAIHVVHQTPTPTQYDFKAAANSILRILIDTRIGRNSLQFVILPDDSFGPIADELCNEHYSKFEEPIEVPFSAVGLLSLRNESSSQSQLMIYSP